MSDPLDAAFEFARRASRYRPLMILLFGSVARGEADARSDVDLLVILDEGQGDDVKAALGEIALDVSREFDRDISLLVTDPHMSGLDRKFLEAALSEGVVLYSRKLSLEAGPLRLEPFVVFSIDMSDLERPEKLRLERALYGRRTKKRRGERVYVSETKGLLEELGGTRLGRGVVLVPSRGEKVLEGLLKRFGARYSKLRVWISPPTLG